MPYVSASQRAKVDVLIDELANAIVAESVDSEDELNASGLVNYSTTRLILSVFRILFPRLRYWHHALVAGILDNVKTEVYRRLSVPFEEAKCELNGDVQEFEELMARV